MQNLTSLPQAPGGQGNGRNNRGNGGSYRPLASETDSSSGQNPFASETQTLASHNSSDQLSISPESHVGHDGGVLHRDYDTSSHSSPNNAGYYYGGGAAAAGAGAGLGVSGNNSLFPPSSRNSSASLGQLSAMEFDRYPGNRLSSAAPSIQSQMPLIRNGIPGSGSGFNSSGYPSSARESQISESSSFSGHDDHSPNNPFVVNADFSPFGGYPASSFPLHIDEKEADDYLHNPDPILDEKQRGCQKMDRRAWGSVLALLCLLVGGVVVFIVVPVLTYSGVSFKPPTIEVVEALTQYKYGTLSALRTNLIDSDTPQDALTRTAKDGSEWNLVFSDEFNVEGRTFYDGDDQFWTAPDFHYAATEDLEWYTPDAVITEKGALTLTLDAFKNHNLFYRSGMVQSWNKLCFTQGIFEASVNLPGSGQTPGLWPGVWTIGNLARPGYGATSEGVWPYGYNECDAGITANQSSTDGISYLPGQKLNACTCPGHDHPNTGTGRGAPEIDAIEGTVSAGTVTLGVASQSLQVAPFDIWYMPDYDFIEVHNKSITAMNTYCGGPFQQAISGTTMLNPDWYELGGSASFQSYGFEYLNDDTDGYIRWFVGHVPAYTLYAPAIGPNGNVGQRELSKEPMSIVMNLGISNSWTYIDWNGLTWPSTMRIDYVRIYQPPGQTSITCDPADYPTYDYIQDHINAYSNPNLTSWAMAGYKFPPNQLLNQC